MGLDEIDIDFTKLQQYLPLAVLKLNQLVQFIIGFVCVATALIVYGIKQNITTKTPSRLT